MKTTIASILSMLSLLLVLVQPANAASKEEIDIKVSAAINRFQSEVQGGQEFLERAKGVLVFPEVIKAGIQPGDIIIALDKKPINSLGDFFRSVWACGDAGVEIPLTIMRETGELDIMVKSGDRESSFRRGLIN